MSNKKEVIEFPEEQDYKARIAAAKQNVPVGGVPMPDMPQLDQVRPIDPRAAHQRAAMLTPEQQALLAQQGKFMPGVGAAYAANQPQPDYFNPPRPEGSGLSQETQTQLLEVAKANMKPTEEEAMKAEIDELEDEFDIDEFGNRVRNLLANRERREAIEARCKPMDIEDLLLHSEVRQTVPIIPGKLEPTYRSAGGHEDLFVKRLMGKEKGPDRYILDKFSLMNLVLSLYSLNGKIFPTHLDPMTNKPDEKLFEVKFDLVMRYPMALLADLGVNFIWFDRRVRKLLVVDNVRNF